MTMQLITESDAMSKSKHTKQVKTVTVTSYRKKGNQNRCPTCGAYRKKG